MESEETRRGKNSHNKKPDIFLPHVPFRNGNYAARIKILLWKP
jgi:hypothetical protein